MSDKSQTQSVQQSVEASPAEVYYAFTNATALREWLCDLATAIPRPGGRMYLWWNGDFYSSGEYIAVEQNCSIAFQWFARFEPAPSKVTVTLAAQNEKTLVTLAHTVPEGDDWKARLRGFMDEWKGSLENLASVLETGQDLRLVRRPMLGILISDFNAEIAAQMRIPVKEGIRLDGAVEGMGARAAGLMKDDVIVSFNGRPITNDFASLQVALAGKRAGDTVGVTFYRGPEQKTVQMTLAGRPIPEIAFEAAKLAETVRAIHADAYAQLAACFEGVREAEATYEPAPGEWSAKQTLAHLIHGERGSLQFLAQVVSGFEQWADDFGGNLPAPIQATLEAFPTVADLLTEQRRLLDETTAYVSHLPPEFVARKGSFWRIAYNLVSGPQIHTHSHLDQIRAAIAAGRKAS